MQNYSTDAINIKTYPISEFDNIVVMFSKDMGLIRGIAKGVKRPKSKLGAASQALVANSLVLSERRNLDIIKEASAINSFNKLRYNLDKLTMAIYITEAINIFCTADNSEKAQNEEIYNLLYKTLDNIQNAQDKTRILLSAIKFQLAFMKLSGFGIELKRCLKCSSEPTGSVLFSPETGGIACVDCAIEQVHYVKMHEKIREFLIALNETPIHLKTKYDDIVNEKVTNSCFNLLKKYIEITGNKKSKAFKVMEETKSRLKGV